MYHSKDVDPQTLIRNVLWINVSHYVEWSESWLNINYFLVEPTNTCIGQLGRGGLSNVHSLKWIFLKYFGFCFQFWNLRNFGGNVQKCCDTTISSWVFAFACIYFGAFAGICTRICIRCCVQMAIWGLSFSAQPAQLNSTRFKLRTLSSISSSLAVHPSTTMIMITSTRPPWSWSWSGLREAEKDWVGLRGAWSRVWVLWLFIWHTCL